MRPGPGRAALLALVLAAPLALAEAPTVLQKRAGTPGAHWDTLDFADLTAKPTTVEGYGITNAVVGDRPQVLTFMYLSDSTEVTPHTVTIFYPAHGDLAGMVCDVLTAPQGADITLDLKVGSPLTSVYAPGTAPRIVAGDTTSLTGTPATLPAPVPLAPRERLQVAVLSAPEQNLQGTALNVVSLPETAWPGSRYLVAADGHVWTRNAYDAVVWTDAGLPAGGEWLGAVATYASLPTATANASATWLVTETAHLWRMSPDVDGHAVNNASLPAADSVASGTVYVTTTEMKVWVADGVSTWLDYGAAWADLGSPWLPNIAFTTIGSSAELPTAALAGSYYLALNTGHLWRNDAPLWLDSGLLTVYAGAGLRCAVYIYPRSS